MKLVGKRLEIYLKDEAFIANIIDEEEFSSDEEMCRKKITVLFNYDKTTKAILMYPEVFYKGYAKFTSSIAQRAVEKEIRGIKEKAA